MSKITKIQDLGKYCMDPFTYYYDSNHTEELVNYLQSKTVKWHKIEEYLPDYHEDLFVLVRGSIHKCSRDYDNYHKNDYFLCTDRTFDIEEVQFWCYESEFLKTLPENK